MNPLRRLLLGSGKLPAALRTVAAAHRTAHRRARQARPAGIAYRAEDWAPERSGAVELRFSTPEAGRIVGLLHERGVTPG